MLTINNLSSIKSGERRKQLVTAAPPNTSTKPESQAKSCPTSNQYEMKTLNQAFPQRRQVIFITNLDVKLIYEGRFSDPTKLLSCNRKDKEMIYLTLYAKQIPQQVSFEDLLLNPYMTVEALPKTELKKFTTTITEEYGKRLYHKKFPYHSSNDPNLTTMLFPVLPEGFDTSQHYRHFEIPKKSNPHKKRPIDAPDDFLSNAQNYYKSYIEEFLKVLPHKAAHAYVEKRSTITAMQQHQRNNSKWFLQLDLKDFFNSIDEAFLRKMLNMVFPFPYIPEANLNNIIKSALLNGSLPQGSHLSPTLTNLVMVPIDHVITETLHNYIGSNGTHHYVYTRYADDITISSKEKFNPKEIENVIREIFKDFEVPFKINEEKTRFGSSAGRNYHVGLILNKDNQISVGHEKNNKFKAMIFNFCTTGTEWEVKDIYRMLGLISYYKAIEPNFVNKILDKYGRRFNMDILATAKAWVAKPEIVQVSEQDIKAVPDNYELPF